MSLPHGLSLLLKERRGHSPLWPSSFEIQIAVLSVVCAFLLDPHKVATAFTFHKMKSSFSSKLIFNVARAIQIITVRHIRFRGKFFFSVRAVNGQENEMMKRYQIDFKLRPLHEICFNIH
jgi:hypothetical protein